MATPDVRDSHLILGQRAGLVGGYDLNGMSFSEIVMRSDKADRGSSQGLDGVHAADEDVLLAHAVSRDSQHRGDRGR